MEASPSKKAEGVVLLDAMKGVSSSLAFTICILVLNLVSGIATARALGPESRGALAVALTWPTMIAGLATLGIPDAVAHWVNRTAQFPEESRRYLSAGWQIACVTGVLGLLAVIGIARIPGLVPQQASVLLLATCTFVVLNHMSQVSVYYLQGSHQTLRWNIARSTPHLVLAILTGVLFFANIGEALWFSIANMLSVAALVILALFLHAPPLRTPSGAHLRSLLSFGLQVHASRLLFFLRNGVDKLLLAQIAGTFELGRYAAVSTLVLAATTIPLTFAGILQPRIGSLFSGSPTKKELENVTALAGLSLLATVIVFGALGLVADSLVTVLFGAEYHTDPATVANLFIAGGLMAATKLSESYFLALRRPLLLLPTELSWLVSFFLLSWLFHVATLFSFSLVLLTSASIATVLNASILALAISALRRA